MRLILLLVFVMLVPTAALAQVVQTKWSISSGGAHSSGGSYAMSSQLGGIIGYSANGSDEVWHGFYAPLPGSTVSVDDPSPTLIDFLGRVSPNPARGRLGIEFGTARAQLVEVSIFDITGRLVRQVHRGSLPAGVHRLHWDARDDAGETVAAGVYFVHFVSLGLNRTTRVAVLR